MRDLDIHHPLQAMEKPYALFRVKRGPNGLAPPGFVESFHQRDEAEGRADWHERHGDLILIVDLRDAIRHTEGMYQ